MKDTASTLEAEAETVVSVERVSKKFCRSLKRSLLYGVQDIAGEITMRSRHSAYLRAGEFWALKDLTFRLRRGAALGLIGPNGSGKSTALRIISGIIKPDAGRVSVKGRVAPLIALGAGFNPILTGRENIFVNMSILGVAKKQIERVFADIIAFAEIGDALDAPVQTYSSGMAARLGFACAVYTAPDILIVDEVLAVGDIKFRAKCYRRLAQMREEGAALILVSHNPNSILSICDSALYLSGGEVVATGVPEDVMSRYEEDVFQTSAEKTTGSISFSAKDAGQSAGVDIRAVYFRDRDGRKSQTLASGEMFDICVECVARQKSANINVSLLVRELFGEGECVLNLSSEKDERLFTLPEGQSEIRLRLPYCGLKPGAYTMKLYLSAPPLHIFDIIESFRFSVRAARHMSQCLYYQPRSWHASSPNDAAAATVAHSEIETQ